MNSPNIMHQWFVYLFEQRMDSQGFVRCFECNKRMHQDGYKKNTCCYSHILSKKTYPQYKGEEWNIAITCPSCHSLYSNRPSDAINQYKKYIQLKKELNL